MNRPAKIFDCVYGGSGTGKSEACARLIESIYRDTGKHARLVIGDGSLLTYEHLITAGVAKAIEFGAMPWPQDTLVKLSSGWWLGSDGLIAPGTPDNDLSNVGIYVFEGLSVAGAYIMGNVHGGLAWRSGRGEKIGQDSPIRIIEGDVDPKTGKLVDGPGSSFGGNPPAHYNVAQRTLLDCLQRSKSLNVDAVIWTAHEATNNPENDLNRELIIGPEVVGKALTTSIQRSFNNTIHMCTVTKRAKMQDAFTGKAVDELDSEYRLYTRDHYSATGATMTRFKAVTRASHEMPLYLVAEEPGLTLLTYYEKLSGVRDQRVAQLTTTHA